MRCVTGNSTCPPVSAGSSFAAIKHFVTTLTCISGAAFAAIAVGELDAIVGASGVTGVRQTLVDVTFTSLAYVTCWAHALVTSNAVYTLSIVEALGLVGQWVTGRGAVIQIDLTVDTLCSSGAGALVRVDEVNAGASILTGLRLTLIDLFGAVYTVVARDTLTTVASQIVSTGGSILAWIG